jgi:predicted ATP-dependent protease
VIIPIQNVADLQLKPEIVASVKAGKFHIYPVSTIDDGIELLTGISAGEELHGGGFTKGSVFDRVDKALDKLAKQYKEKPDGDNDKNDVKKKNTPPPPPKKRKSK